MKRFELRRAIYIAGLVLTSTTAARAKGVRELLQATIASHGVPAMAAAVVTGDQVLELAAEGIQRLDLTTRVLPSDRFHNRLDDESHDRHAPRGSHRGRPSHLGNAGGGHLPRDSSRGAHRL